VAIFLSILITAACGTAAGIFLGGFWWVVFGLLFGAAESLILFGDELIDDDAIAPVIIGIIFLLLGGIAAGLILGGFWWVILGFVIGLVLGAIIYGLSQAGEFGAKLLAFLLPIFAPTGAVLGYALIDRHWLVALLGTVAGGLASLILSLPFIIYRKIKAKNEAILIAEEDRRKKEEKERKRLAKEEYERNRPIEEKLAELGSAALKKHQENSTELKEAKRELSKYKVSDLNERFDNYINDPDSYKAFETGFGAIFDSTAGIEDAQVQVMIIQGIAEGYAARYRVSAAKAKLENDIYTANRKKALLFVERLKDIYEKLTPTQKKRKIEDAAKALKIGSLSVKIPNLPNIDSLTVKLNNQSKREFVDYASNFGKFTKDTGLSLGTSAAVYLAGGIIGKAMSNYENNEKVKLELFKSQQKIIKKIPKLEAGRLQAEGFAARAEEINRALEGTMSTYEKMFVDIYNTLYPPDDATKSKEARTENKKNGGKYFNEDEVDAVIYLKETSKILEDLVDMNFEGE